MNFETWSEKYLDHNPAHMRTWQMMRQWDTPKLYAALDDTRVGMVAEKLTETQAIDRVFHWYCGLCVGELLYRGEPVLEHIERWQPPVTE